MRLRPEITKLAPHFAIALALALLLTWPAVLDLRGSMLGHPGNDTWNHAWGFWWVADSLGQGQVPLHTDLLDHPKGGALFFIDSFIVALVGQHVLGIKILSITFVRKHSIRFRKG